MDSEKNKKEERIWLSVFSVTAAIVSVFAIAERLPGSDWLFKAIVSVLGAGLGLSVYFLTHRQSRVVKGAALAGLLGLLLAGSAFLPWSRGAQEPATAMPAVTEPQQDDGFRSCLVCGYRAIPPDTLLCQVCSVELTETERVNWEYASLEEMLREEQAMFFAAEGFRDSVAFYEPSIWESEGVNYRKDTTWRPVIDTRRVLMMRDTLIRAGVIEKQNVQ